MGDVTRLLKEIDAGQTASTEQLLPIVYDELYKLARHRMRQERSGHTLNTTGLLHEAYLRLVDGNQSQQWSGRAHFFAAAAEAMRRILINHARDRARLKRGGGRRQIDLDKIEVAANAGSEELLAVDEAVQRLAEEEKEHYATLVKLRFYAGMTIDEAAEALDVSRSTAKRYWSFARAWLVHELQSDKDDQALEP